MLLTTSIQREMHGKDIATEGYKAILKMQNSSRQDITTISISVQNEFGNVTKIYVVNKNNNQSKIIVLEMMIAIYIYIIYINVLCPENVLDHPPSTQSKL